MLWIKTHPHWAGLVVLLVSALESFLVVGLFVPGTVVMFGIGTMIAAGSMELMPTLILAAIGAVIGDGTSYFIGRHYHQRLRVMWPFRNYPQMISRGVDFFHQHGGKSLVLARFVGPVRPLVPAVAGMLDRGADRHAERFACPAFFPGECPVRHPVGARLHTAGGTVRRLARDRRGNCRTSGSTAGHPAGAAVVLLVAGAAPLAHPATACAIHPAAHSRLVTEAQTCRTTGRRTAGPRAP
ncbi:MAG: DedA family protein [Thiogranum sp.]